MTTPSTYSVYLSKDVKDILKRQEKNVGGDMRDYLRKIYYCDLKFLPMGKRDRNIILKKIMENSIEEKFLTVLRGLSKRDFCEYFKEIVPKGLAKLRHNTQTLARRNWRGEY